MKKKFKEDNKEVMVVETTEQVDTKAEQEDAETPTSEAETAEETEVSETPESENEDAAPKLSEKAKQDLIKAEYAKWQSKTLNPIVKERDTLRQQVSELTAQLEGKNDDKELDLLLKADMEELGEDEAKKLDAVRRNYKARLKEYRENKTKIDQTLKKTEADAEKLGSIERHQQAVAKAYELLVPQEKNFRKQLDSIVSELEEAESPEHMERLLKIIIRERQGKTKPTTLDSSRNSGGGSEKLSNLSPKDRVKEADRRLRTGTGTKIK